MNTREYIESGNLEAYALGALSEKESQDVLAAVAMYPDVAKELGEIETVMQEFTASLAKQPPANMQERIWGQLQNASVITGSGNGGQAHAAKTIPFPGEYRKPAAWKYAAIWIGLVGSVAANAMLWMRNEHKNADMAALNAKVSVLEQDQKQIAGALADYRKNKTMMADTGMQTVVMHTVQPGHAMAATLYWSKSKGEAYVNVDGLPTPPKGMQYQLWVMQDGKPVDMGVLPVNIAGTPAMQKIGKSVTDGQAFAISLEKEGGSPTPTMQNIYVMGKVS